MTNFKGILQTPRDIGAYIMDPFNIMKRKGKAAYGNYRTRDTIFSIKNEMAEALRT